MSHFAGEAGEMAAKLFDLLLSAAKEGGNEARSSRVRRQHTGPELQKFTATTGAEEEIRFFF